MEKSHDTADPGEQALNRPVPKMREKREISVLIFSVFLAGLCSIVYELLISTASSYFLGDSIRQFSVTIGLYMASMGIGSYLSRRIKAQLVSRFIAMEIALGLLGGVSIPILYGAYAYTEHYQLWMAGITVGVGIFIGLEIPLLTRIMEKYYSLKLNISNVLSMDYFGALVATLLFPFVLLPVLGTFRNSLFFGIINMIIGFLNLWCFREALPRGRRLRLLIFNIAATLVLVLLFAGSWRLISMWSNRLYDDPVIYSKQTKYQNIVLTKKRDDLRLFINGNLQFSSSDEYRYHESLVHVPMLAVPEAKNVCILGGGDGLAVRELLKYTHIEHITVVDIDPEITRISSDNRWILALNKGSLQDERVLIRNTDAFQFIKDTRNKYDLIISDLPDPNNVSIARMYSREFFRYVYRALNERGVFVIQSTSPSYASRAFWTIHNTVESAGFERVRGYHTYIPSFGDWGFNLGLKGTEVSRTEIQVPTKYLHTGLVSSLFVFGNDIQSEHSDISTLDDPRVMHYYHQGWRKWN